MPSDLTWPCPFPVEHRRAMARVARYFNRLPPGLHAQAVLLRTHLIGRESATDDLNGLFSTTQSYPALHLHQWVLAGQAPTDPELVESLSQAACCTAAAAYLSEEMLDPAGLTGIEAIHLIGALRDQAHTLLAPHLARSPALRAGYEDAWNRFAEVQHTFRSGTIDGLDLEPGGILHFGAGYWAPHILPALAAAAAGDPAPDLEALQSVLRKAGGIFQLIRDFHRLQRDLEAGRISGLLRRAMAAAGLSSLTESNRERVLGALILSDTAGELGAFASDRLAASREAARGLGLDAFEPLFSTLAAGLESIQGLFNPAARPGGKSTAPFHISPAPDTLETSLKAAQAYLQSDPSLKESWEIHRYGLLGKDEVIARFPAGLVIEMRCLAGDPCGADAAAFISDTAGRNFAYFDDPDIPARDADTLGLVLRLRRWAGDLPPDTLAGLDAALETLPQSLDSNGRFPVWLDRQDPTGAGLRMVGEDCGIVEAHLLLGLLEGKDGRFENIIRRSAAGLLERFKEYGAGVSVNYPPLYALETIGRLLEKLDSGRLAPPERGDFSEIYRDAFKRALDRPGLSPQAAALAILAGQYEGTADLVRPGWAGQIRKRQLPDGSWPAEPFCFVANRGNTAGWYMSRTMTTAICYRASRLSMTN